MPCLSAADAAMHAANDLIAALCNPAPAAPFRSLQTEHHDAQQKLAEFFNNVTVLTAAPTLTLKEPTTDNNIKELRVNDVKSATTQNEPR
eukprot:364944-Ditylum_brightwellii.AAC.1